MLLLETLHLPLDGPVQVYVIRAGAAAQTIGLHLAEQLRSAMPSLKLQLDCAGGSVKSQFKKADKSGAQYALILGEDEVLRGEVGVKSLRDATQAQQNIALQDVIVHLKAVNFL